MHIPFKLHILLIAKELAGQWGIDFIWIIYM